MSKRPMRKKGFTLVEILVVVSIIALLMAILVPAVAVTHRQSRRILCLSNLKQLSLAAQIYADNNDDYYPLAYIMKVDAGVGTMWDWDFLTIIKDGKVEKVPGLLWQGNTNPKILQCPSYRGRAWGDDPYTGYNYNRSYIGGCAGMLDGVIVPFTVVMSVKNHNVKGPSTTAIFGDAGENIGGKPNKYMLSPFPGKLETFCPRSTGVQSYRHLQKTNVAYCDGSASSTNELYTETDDWSSNELETYNQKNIDKKVGFLSKNNNAYNLR